MDEQTISETPDVADISFTETTPVTGQGRMDAAWGSRDGDELATAQVATNNASVGYVFEQIYRQALHS